MDKKILYAAYGSNINLEQMAFRCPNSTVAGTAMLKGYELQFRHHATIEQNEESEVPVLLWELDSQDERFLDKYEGWPKYYRKESITLELNGESVEAMIYIMNGDRPLESPTAQYYDIIEQGYRENGLDTSYLETALAEAVQSENLEMNEEMQIGFDIIY
ncbi:gamma-glutamylcyclotransferase family protein [Porcipelethomonas sp.]|uniref:gamma-glutamylcyclotransferase family protein n=1 Tax=Porcipelethomonas sp. TaxID=2981675 RepID=UPI00307850B5